MAYTTFAAAKGFVRSGSGECDDAALGVVVNKVRRHIFNWYGEIRLFADAVEAFQVQRFCSGPDGHRETFNGITLPREAASIEAMWWNNWPIELRSSWREWQAGITPYCDCGLQKFDLPGYFSTVADLDPGHPKFVRYQCYRSEDVGKKLRLRGITDAGAPFYAELTLGLSPESTSEKLSFIDHQGGVQKDETAGRVALSTEDGRLLGMYEPDETVASYRRVKITGLRPGCSVVNVRTARRYFPLIGDNDVVETDNAPAFDSMARYLRSYERATKTVDDLRIEKDHIDTAKRHVLGDKAREFGKSTQVEIKIDSSYHGPPAIGGRW